MKPGQPPSSDIRRQMQHPGTKPHPVQEADTVRPAAAGVTGTLPPKEDSDATSSFVPHGSGLPDALPAKFGRYELLKLLGKGGMGTVYLAHDLQLDRQVALKVPQFAPAAGPSVAERFFREARAAATLQHANICPVYDVGEVHGTHYLTMAYIEGRPLCDVIRTSAKPLLPRQAAALVRKLALALDEAHRKKVIHRDLKPANVMLNRRGEPVLMDFGLARRGGANDAPLTHYGAVMGTPAYMAPEQAKGNPDEMGPACDIYSLGVILYELLAGRLPFEGDTLAILSQLLMDEPQPPSAYRPGVDRHLEAICLKAISKRPEARHRTMGELAAALSEYLKATSQSAQGGAAAADPAPEVPLAEWMLDELKPPSAAEPKASSGSRINRLGEQQAGVQQELELRRQAALLRQKRRTAGNGRFPAYLWMVGAAGIAALIAGIVILVPTERGTVRIELNDPDAQVEIKVDGTIDVTNLDEPLHLEVGEHGLVVTGKNYETVSKSFVVKRGDNPVLRVELQETEQTTVKSAPTPPAPARPGPPAEQVTTQPRPTAIEPPSAATQPPPVATQPASSPAPEAASPERTAARQPLPRDRWIQLDASTPNVSSWAWGKPRRNAQNKSWENGVLSLDNGAVAFNSIQARDVSFRAQVKFIEGQNMALVVRDKRSGSIYAFFNRLQDGRMHVALLKTKKSKVLARKDDFFEFRVTAIGNRVTIQVNGETVIEHQEAKKLDAGIVSVTAYNARGMFKEIEVKILD